VNAARTISDAPYDSRLRNEFNPDPARREIEVYCPAQPILKNLALRSVGAQARASENDGDPTWLLHNPYNRPVLTLETLPAWVEIHWPKEHRIDEVHIQPGAPEWVHRPITECVPLDYRLQYLKGSQWLDLIPPVTNARRYAEFYGSTKAYLIQDEEFEYIHKFTPISVKAIRMYITRSSDLGRRAGSGDKIVVPEDQRATCLRMIEVFEAKAK
jgi:hypothetical protein